MQRAGYEVLIIDCSSDVCSSDLIPDLTGYSGKVGELVCHFFLFYALGVYFGTHLRRLNEDLERREIAVVAAILLAGAVTRLEGRGVGKECVSTCRTRWSTETKKKKRVNTRVRIRNTQSHN